MAGDAAVASMAGDETTVSAAFPDVKLVDDGAGAGETATGDPETQGAATADPQAGAAADAGSLAWAKTRVTPMKTAFLDALPEAKQKEFHVAARQQYQTFLKDQSTISEFGRESVEKVNSVVDSIIDAQKDIRIPEVDDLLEQANRDLDGFVAKYSDEAKELKEPGKFFKWLHKTKRKAQDAAFDRKNLAARLDVIDGKIVGKREELKRSFQLIDNLKKANNESTNSMVGVLAALEAVYLVAASEADALKVRLASLDSSTPEWQETSDKLADAAEVANAVEAQHANYMARLAVAWATNS